MKFQQNDITLVLKVHLVLSEADEHESVSVLLYWLFLHTAAVGK